MKCCKIVHIYSTKWAKLTVARSPIQ